MRRVQVKVQIHRQTSRWLRTKPRLRVWNEQYDRRRKVKIDLRRFGFILCLLLGWIFVRIKKKKRKGERKTKRALFFLLWNVASSSSCLLDCTRALLIILSIATTHTAHIRSTLFPSLARSRFREERPQKTSSPNLKKKRGERDVDDGNNNNNNNNTNSSARTRYSCDLLIISIITIFFPFSVRTTRRFVVIHICR